MLQDTHHRHHLNRDLNVRARPSPSTVGHHRSRLNNLSAAASLLASGLLSACQLEPIAAAASIQAPRTQLDRRIQERDTHIELGLGFFAAAQRALETGDESTYTDQLSAAQEEILVALELDPGADVALNLLAILAAYRADIDGARQSFERAHQLAPTDPHYPLNLAEIAIYQGRLPAAHALLDLARKLGARASAVELNEVLVAWRQGDLYTARDIFNAVTMLDPEESRTWNGASSIESFEDFTAHCCRLPFCGQHMAQACEQV